MKVITINLNGIRSAARKGFFDWMIKEDADFVCVQETRAQLEHLHDGIFRPTGYFSYFHDAIKKGYSGTGIYSKREPLDVKIGLGWQLADEEGRSVELVFDKFNIISLYVPSGTSGEIRQNLKYDFMDRYLQLLHKMRHGSRDYIIAGDINIAHKEIDLKHWRANQNHSGFLPDERAWLDNVFSEVGFIDAFRVLNKEPNQYTWWSNFGRAWDNNAGWRIDYQIVTPNLKDKITKVSIYKHQRFSDHAPLVIEYDYIV